MLEPGCLLPDFTVRTLEGAPFSYASVWQRRNLVLIVVPADGGLDDRSREAPLAGGPARQVPDDSTWIVANGPALGHGGALAIVADRWGEIHYVARAARASELPGVEELQAWLDYVRDQCPECQGEAR